MQKYQNSVTGGVPLRATNGASVRVTDADGALATLYSDNGVTVMDNPITTGPDGEYAFYAANGRYSIAISASGFVGESVSDVLLYDPADERANVLDYFVAGETTSGAMFQRAIDAVNAAGGGALAWSGRHTIDAALTVKDGVWLKGPLARPGEMLPGSGADYDGKAGALLLNSAATITVQDSAAVTNCMVIREGLDLPFADATAAATGLAAFAGTALTVGGADACFRDLLVLGFARAIDCASYERTTCERVYGDCTNGIRLATVYDIARVNDCHFWPWTTTHQSWTTDALLTRSGTAYEFSAVGDWSKFFNCFSYGYNRGYVVDSCDNVSLIGCGADYPGALASSSVAYEVKGTSKEATLVGCQAAAQGTGLLVNTSAASGGVVTAVGCNFWDNDTYHVRLQTGRLVVAGGTRFRNGAVGVQVAATSEGASVVGNDFDGVTTPIAATGTALEKSTLGPNRFFNCVDTLGTRKVFDNQAQAENVTVYNSSGIGYTLAGRGARGSAGTPTTTQDADQLLRAFGYGYTGAAWGVVGNWRFQADGTASAGSTPGKFVLATTPSGAVAAVDRYTIGQDGHLLPVADITYNVGSAALRLLNLYTKQLTLSPPSSVTPASNGDVNFQLTSDQSLAFKVKGSDGTVRSVALPLVSTGPAASSIILAQSAVASATLTGSTAETTLATVAIPAGLMGLNGALRITARYSCTASVNNKTFRTKLGGTTFIAPGTTGATIVNFKTICTIANRNSASSQIGDGDSAGIGGAGSSNTGTVNTATAQNVTITGQLANAADSMALEYYLVEFLPG